MQIKRENANGALYQMAMYAAGALPGTSPRQREGRRQVTTEAKAAINKSNAKWRLMQLICANFVSGRDLFVCLTYESAPTGRKALETFHKRMKAACARRGVVYRYIHAEGSHDLDGVPVRLHHHLILPADYQSGWAELIAECWQQGAVDVRRLREGTDFFEDTAMYLLEQKKGKGARHYSTSRNLTPPCEPIRTRVPESEPADCPPGVAIVEMQVRATEFGAYTIMVGRIFDSAAFDAYWARQRKRAAPDPWERLRRRRDRR